MRSIVPLLAALAAVVAVAPGRAGGPFLREGDVIALVGGEDMVVAAECGRLELLLVRAMPGARLKFRGLAWEGDTVFEQPRDLNYPTLEQQLDEAGATVVIAQFGQMESLGGAARLPEFVAAYERMIERLAGGGKRRVVLLGPTPVSQGLASSSRFASLGSYAGAVRELAARHALAFIIPNDGAAMPVADYRDGLHMSEEGHGATALRLARALGVDARAGEPASTDALRLADAIRAKNRMWFNYYRPQNWAFLNGDRTTQPSSRDHIDPSRRWFPEEMKLWLPLIAAKEEEIGTLAEKAAAK